MTRRVSLPEGYRRALALRPATRLAGWDDLLIAVGTGGASLISKKNREGAVDTVKAIGGELEKAFDGPWDAFADVCLKNIHALKPPYSLQDVMSVTKAVALGGASVLADGGIAALNDFIFSKLAKYGRYIAEGMGGCVGEARDRVSNRVEQAMREQTDNAALIRLAREFVLANYDLLTGYPPCMCEEGCIKNVSKGLKDAGGIPGVIGQVLWYLWPIMQGRPSEDLKLPPTAIALSPCLYWYGNNGQLLLNAQLGDAAKKSLGSIMKYMNEDKGKNFTEGLPQSFDAYRPYLVDLVARGYDGPEAMGGTGRNARYYFDHPGEAAAIVSSSKVIDRQIAKVTQVVDKYLGWIMTAAEAGKVVYDLYQSQGSGGFDPSSIDAADVQRLLGRFTAKGHDLVESSTSRYAKALTEKLDLGDVAQAYSTLAKGVAAVKQAAAQKKHITKIAVPGPTKAQLSTASSILKAGGVVKLAGLNGFGVTTGQAFMTEWQPAQIGLEARQRWNHMVYAWAHFTDAEKAKFRLDEGTNEQVWATTGVNYNGSLNPPCGPGAGSWYKLLTTDKRALQAIYNVNLPTYYADWLAGALGVVDQANAATRKVFRSGSTGFLPNPFKWSFTIPGALIPSPRDVGWNTRSEGYSATPEQYVMWFDELRNLYDPRRWKTAFDTAYTLWTHGTDGSPSSWRKDTVNGAKNPPIAWRAPLFKALTKSGVKVAGSPTGYLTRKSFWAMVMDAGGIRTMFEVATQQRTTAITAPVLRESNPIMPPLSVEVLKAVSITARDVAQASLNDPTLATGGAGEESSSILWWILGGIGVAALLRWRLSAD